MLSVWFGARRVLDKFEQHAAGRSWVDECDEAAARTVAWLLVYQACALGFEARERGADIRDTDGDVMYAGAALLQKLGDG